MADSDTNAAAATQTAAAAKPKTVAADMPQRSIFATVAEAEQFLAASAERYSDFVAIAQESFVAPAQVTDDEGNTGLDAAVYDAPGMNTMITLLRNKGKKDASGNVTAGSIKAIVCAPIPTLELLLGVETLETTPETAAAIDFVRAIINKELNHRAVRALRDAENVRSVVDQIPTTMDAYIASSRDAGGLMEPFNELYKSIIVTLSSVVPAFAKRRFIKQELRKAMESKGYALDTYPELEEAGVNGSIFEKAIALGIATAKRKGMDSTIFERWAETRATKIYSADDDDTDEVELDLESLTTAMLTEPAKPADAAAAPATQEPATTE